MGGWGCSQTPCYGQQKGNGGQGAGQLGLLWNWEEPVLACPYLSLFWERPAGGTLSQASYLQMQHRPSADPGSCLRSSAPTWALLCLWGPPALKNLGRATGKGQR